MSVEKTLPASEHLKAPVPLEDIAVSKDVLAFKEAQAFDTIEMQSLAVSSGCARWPLLLVELSLAMTPA